MPKKAASISAQDYLERIHELIQEKGYARAIDVAEALGISQPSVTSMVQKLAAQGLLNYEKYRGMTLTPAGLDVAESIQRRHVILKRFLTLLGVPEVTQEADIEGMEHHLSEATLEAFSRLSDRLEQDPELLRR